MYHQRARKYLTGLVNQRLRLLKTGKSYRSSAVYSAEHLKKYLDYYPYDKDYQMARFFIKNLSHILNVIPVGKHPSFDSSRLKAMNFKNQAIIILNINHETDLQ